MSEEDTVIDGIGKAQPPRPATPVGEAIRGNARPAEPGPVTAASAASGAAQAPATSKLARIASELAASPPVDTAKVAALRAAIVNGAYRADPAAIAERMIALETVPPKA